MHNIFSTEIFPPTHTTLSEGIERIIMVEFSLHVNQLLFVRKSCYQLRTSKIVACQIHLKKDSIILISAYRPPNTNYEYLEELCSTLSHIALSNPDKVIWLAGDLNFPNIDWNSYCINGHNYPLQLRMWKFIDTLLDPNLFQFVGSPTRKENILDIFATNWPSLVTSCTTIPGVSDHEAVLISAKIQPSGKRKKILWQNW